MTEPVKRYNLRQNMPATATTFLPDVVVSATDYASLEQEYAELVERYGKLQTGEGHITHRVIAERDAALKQVERLTAMLHRASKAESRPEFTQIIAEALSAKP